MSPLLALIATLAAAPADAPSVLWLTSPASADAGVDASMVKALDDSPVLRRLDAAPLERALFDARMAVKPDTVQSDVVVALRRARDAYRKMGFTDAMRVLQEVENTHLGALSCPEASSLAAQVSLQAGAIDAATREPGRAQERFRTALFVDPTLKLDKVFFPPHVVKVFDEVYAGLGALERGSLSLVTEPAGADVFVDGRSSGAAPVTLQLQEGVHYLCVRRLGSKPWTARLQVGGGKLDSQRVFLDPASREEVAAQLLALPAAPAELDLSDRAVAGALLTLEPAAAVAQWVAPDSVRFVAAGASAASGLLTPRRGETPAERAADVVAQLEQKLGARPTPTEPVAETQPTTLGETAQLELTGRAAAAGEGVVGFHGGARLGIQLPFLPWLAVGLTAGFEASSVAVGYTDPAASGALAGRVAGLVPVKGMIPVSLELRVVPVRSGKFHLRLMVGAELRLTLMGPFVPNPQGGTPFSFAASNPVPPVSVRLGPTLGVGFGLELTRNLRLLAQVAWTPSALLGPSVVPTTLHDAAASTDRQVVLVPQSVWQHQVSGALGLAWAFR